jgi:hypothetical protein
MNKALKNFLHLYALLLALLACNIAFWSQTHHIRPALDVVPPVPSKEELALLKMGDDQFYFRSLALQMQNAGDTYGRFTALREYDMNEVYRWGTLLDTLDPHSDMMPALVAYYFSQTQKTEDVRPLVNYLYEHSVRDVAHNWWWLLQAIYLAQYRLNDMDLAMKVANPLVDKSVPIWAQQMAAVVHEKRGEMQDALQIMETIKNNADAIPERDLRYMVYFVKERLKRLDKLKDFKDVKTTPQRPPDTRPKDNLD